MEAIVVFDLGTVLSITTSVLLTNIDNVYKILDYMTGDELFTHQLPRVSDEMKPVIFEQYPQLKEVDASKVTSLNWKEFLDKQTEKYGNSFPITPCGLWEHKKIDAQEELVDMLGGDESKVIIVDPSIFKDESK